MEAPMKKVVKFGGSSLASAKQFKKVGDIIRADKSRRYVVPSAPGKRNKNDEKVKNILTYMLLRDILNITKEQKTINPTK